MEKLEVSNLFKKMIQDEDLISFHEPVKSEEIKKVLDHFKRDKSPGPDGWTMEFFISFFDFVSEYLVQMVEESRIYGKIHGCLNSTFLTLIPKENNPSSFGYFRLISLCNLCYKLISKIISNRINPILSSQFSEEQFGFIEGRRIQDAIGTAFECLHSISKRKNRKYFLLKVDLRKAYESVDWDFLHLVLL
jgi:hypothetical protein